MRQLIKQELITDIMTNNYVNTGPLTTNLCGSYFSFSFYFVSRLIKIIAMTHSIHISQRIFQGFCCR